MLSRLTIRELDERIVQRRAAPLFDPETRAVAQEIVDAVRVGGVDALRKFAQKFKEIDADGPVLRSRAELEAAYRELAPGDRVVLDRSADRITRFAAAQAQSLRDLELAVPTGLVGHRFIPFRRAGCYAPGGRYPLPSSVLMTVLTAKAAGVGSVLVASPNPQQITLAAAYLAGADEFLCVGGAQAIAAMAYGVDGLCACEIVVGPGNRWVTAAKAIVRDSVAIDMLAGPSDVLIVADQSASAELIAADLLAQAEHDPDAVPMVLAFDEQLLDKIDRALAVQLETLPTREIAEAALRNGFAVRVAGIEQAIECADKVAPEHLELMLEDAEQYAKRFSEYGAMFIGALSAEVCGDYGAGPNHVLPTGGTARISSGLSVMTFKRLRTWLSLKEGEATDLLLADTARFAELEGLEAHAVAARKRLRGRFSS